MFQLWKLRSLMLALCLTLLRVADANAQSGSVSSNSPCQLATGQSTCSVNVSWSKSNSPIACLWVSTGSLFACSGNDSDSAVWPYASMNPDVLILRAHSSWNSILASDPEIARTTVRAITPAVPAYQSTFVGQNIPATMTAGQTYAVSVTMRNDGSDTWSAATNYNLGSQNVQDNTVWGLGRVATPGTVGPGQDVIFPFNVTAPSTPGMYNFQWRMVRDGVTWFGAQTTNVAIAVVAPTQQLAPTCSSVGPSTSTTTVTSGTFRVYAYGVTNTTSMVFPTWGDVGGQDDLYWYPGVNAGGGTWYADVNLANHKAGNAEYGVFNTHAYMSNATHAYVPCGATSWTRTASTAYSYSDFIPYGAARTGYFSSPPTGATDPNAFWKTTPRSGTWTDVQWGPPSGAGYLGLPASNIEEHEIKANCYGGQTFVWVNAYRNDYAPAPALPAGGSFRFPVTTTKALLIDANGTTDITSGGNCGTNGQPYAKHSVDGNPYTIRVWGNLYDHLGGFARRWFWQARYTLNIAVENSCWTGSGPKTRPALRQEEVWWDSSGGWIRGTGDLGVPTNGPFVGSATVVEPTGNGLVMLGSGYWGLGAGWLWQGTQPGGVNYCLVTTN
jgi:hypothetical protein